jgi:hypothetical protein
VEGLYFPAALVLLALACLVMGLFGAESRPGFDESRSDKKERWFFHSRND